MTREVLVALSYDGGHAEVTRDGRDTWLEGTQIGDAARGRLWREGVSGGRFVVGGLLPSGATRAIVIAPSGEPVDATCGGGAWLAVVAAGDGHEPPVRFDDEAGQPVRPEPPAELIRRRLERRRRERERVLHDVDFPAYALVGGSPPELGGWGRDMARVTEVTVRHDGVEVTSARLSSAALRDPVERARDAFFASAGRVDDDWPELSQGALTLLIRDRERSRIAALTPVRPSTVEIEVDATAVPFAAYGKDGSWAMAATLDGAYVTVTGTGRPPESVALRAITSLADEIASEQ